MPGTWNGLGVDFGDLTHDEWLQLLVYGAFGLYLALAIPRLFRGRFLAGLGALVFWIGLLGVTLVAYAYRYELQAVGQRVIAVAFPGTVVETAPNEVTVFRRPDGQFNLDAEIGRTRLSFVLDTGASTVVLRSDDAARLGIPVRRLAYEIPVSTANGQTLTAPVTLPSLRVGGITETDVDALVARPGALGYNLLGMSFLNRLESYTFRNDRVVLRGE